MLPEEELNKLPTIMRTLHDEILHMSRDKENFVGYYKVHVPKEYNFYSGEDRENFYINFEDIFIMFNLLELDSMMIRLWALYQAQECRRLGTNHVGIIDPMIMAETHVKTDHGKAQMTTYISDCLVRYKDMKYVLMPYNVA